MNFKRCSTVAALLLATSLPAFAQDDTATTLTIPEGFTAPEGSILLTFQGQEELYVVPYEVAAEFCDVSTLDLTTLAEAPQTEVIYCEDLDEARFEELVTAGSITPMSSFEDADDDNDDGDFSDDAEEAADEEAIEDAEGDNDLDDEDDIDEDNDDGLDGVDDSADVDGDDTDDMDGDDMDGDDTAGGGMDDDNGDDDGNDNNE